MKWTLLVPVITIECKLCINRLRFRYYVCVRRWPILWHQFRRTLFIRVIPFNFYPSAIWSEYAILFWCLPLLQIFQIVIIVSIRIALQKKPQWPNQWKYNCMWKRLSDCDIKYDKNDLLLCKLQSAVCYVYRFPIADRTNQRQTSPMFKQNYWSIIQKLQYIIANCMQFCW